MIDHAAEAFALIMKDGQVHQFVGDSMIFDDLDQARSHPGEKIVAVPFRQALWGDRPMSGAERRARQHISTIQVHDHEKTPLRDFLAQADLDSVDLLSGHFDVNDQEYAERVRTVIDNEIRAGHGSNFVLHRTYQGRIDQRDPSFELSIFHALLRKQVGAYWTYLVHFPDHTLIGASPEMHLSRTEDGLTTMNPISGTYRYPSGGPDAASLREFLHDPKERNELYMVVDEELKIMADLCKDRPWVSGPKLRFMSKLAHTEYFIHGYSSLDWATAIRRSLIAPTILGSPLESAFRMAARNDLSPRGYLGGVLAHVSGKNTGDFDSTILIRTACIEQSGDVSIPVGSTIVRDSDPVLEAAETSAKVSTVLTGFSRRGDDDALASLGREFLESRRSEVADFWNQEVRGLYQGRLSSPRRVLVVDHEDRFTGMLAAHLRAMGLDVQMVTGYPTEAELASADLLVLGPGPGDPNDDNDPRIANARSLAKRVVTERRVPTLAVCLSHQLVCRELGFEVRRLPLPNQGTQRSIQVFGEEVRVGFYNSFCAFGHSDTDLVVEVASDNRTGEIHAVRTDNLIGFQFHPESILSVDGARVLRSAVETLLKNSTTTAMAVTQLST
ncbi:anthranilate synthase family protein [Brevibacterium casei]|uniref:anthranilate synthase family protein n=1 Tax=Brevibacterium casei TaxID=33889 RepID=UPI00223AA845|nr:anthranilate synthase family protein [Brevibacterium casei]MCT2184472.1 anthranilate synthase family protein [Brevibacterium casei]